MITLVFICIMLGPQLFAGHRSVGPAAHLTLLLFSMCIVTASLAAVALQAFPAPPPSEDAQYYVGDLNPLSYATIGLALLTPFYWAVEHFSPDADMRIDEVLAQTLALAFTAVILGGPHQMMELATLVLTIALLARALWNLHTYQTQN